jgi:hypothetical protein
VPGGAAGLYEPGSEAPLWWGRYDDKVRGLGMTSLLDRCTASQTCPKVVETFGSSEFWGLRMSPDLVGTDARADIPLPPNVRRYYYPGVTHGGGNWGFRPPPQSLANRCTLRPNPNPTADTDAALTAALVAWVVEDKAPPASRYPTLAAGDLVAPTALAMGFPQIPGAPRPDGKINALPIYDFGPQLVPRVNADGNETAGVPSVQHQVPLGTYLGWNVQAAGYAKGQGCGFEGGFIPFASTKAERLAAGDPRPSLEERYGDHAGFVAAIRAAVDRQVQSGFLQSAAGERIVQEAERSSVLQ